MSNVPIKFRYAYRTSFLRYLNSVQELLNLLRDNTYATKKVKSLKDGEVTAEDAFIDLQNNIGHLYTDAKKVDDFVDCLKFDVERAEKDEQRCWTRLQSATKSYAKCCGANVGSLWYGNNNKQHDMLRKREDAIARIQYYRYILANSKPEDALKFPSALEEEYCLHLKQQ